MSHAFPPSSLRDADAQTASLIAAEERRQRESIIMIPSESWTPPPVREAVGSVLGSIYAEGYPRKAMMRLTPEQLADVDAQLSSYRRYADRRFYKGTEIADLVESLAARRTAECFATDTVPVDSIFANVQPLSGAAANLAVYEAFLEPGDTILALALTEGGHLTHGSPFSVTGKRYNIVSYSVDRSTGKLDYEAIERLALNHRPKLVIGGFTSYPWQPDWQRFRAIADAVGAMLLADIAHTAGLVVGGAYPNPIGQAHVTTFTTHKTLCGPRGAVILSTDPKIAAKIDSSVFPGQQGGPHVNKFAGLAVAMKLAQSDAFADLQQRIVRNAAALAEGLQDHGLTLAYGGTDTHLLLVDLRPLPTDTGYILMGEVASRILELVGIVCNKNTLPGDRSAADAHGIRLGTPWATQRGFDEDHMRAIASIVAEVLLAIRPFEYVGLTGPLSRGKLPLSTLEKAKEDTRRLISRVDSSVSPGTAVTSGEAEGGAWRALRLRAGRVRALLNEATTIDLFRLPDDEPRRTFLFDGEGRAICESIVGRLGEEDYVVLVPQDAIGRAEAWLIGLAEGYTLFDPNDIYRKVQGPAVVERLGESEIPTVVRGWLDAPADANMVGRGIADVYRLHSERFALDKPYFVGQGALSLPDRGASQAIFAWSEPEKASEALRQTALHDDHVSLGAKLVPFAGWSMPVWYASSLEEHRSVRERAGLFDLGHMGVFQVEGSGSTTFLNLVTSNYAAWLQDGTSQYAYLFDVDGNVLDDIFIYRRAADRYLLVVNAANEQKDWAWLKGLQDGQFALDRGRRVRMPPDVRLRDLKAERGVVDLALQGPRSQIILERLLDPEGRRRLAMLERTQFIEQVVDQHQLIVARTGYTGEETGYEIYVGGRSVPWLWERLLDAGKPDGLTPCGLAARDSARTEAGFPLYGHELAGPHQVNPFEAGFASYIKLHKPFFVGRAGCVDQATRHERAIVRFAVEPGARPLRAGSAVLDRNGVVLGWVTSCVSLGGEQVGMALVSARGLNPGTVIELVPPARRQTRSSDEVAPGDRLPVHVRGTILPRFLVRAPMPKSGEE